MLGVLPQDFNAVQLGAVGRQEEQTQSLPRPASTTALDGFRTMDAGIVEHHNMRLCTGLRTEPVEERDHVLLPRGSFEGAPHQRLVLVERPQHIDTLSVRLRLNRMRVTPWCPAIADRRVRAEAGFIKKEQAAQSLPGQFSQSGEDRLRAPKGRFIALFFTS